MASLCPSDVPARALAGAHEGELATLARLRRDLPPAYRVFHSVHWTNEWKSGASFGEADFVIVTPAGKVLLIEQKNGQIDEEGGALTKSYADGSKDVVAQLHRSLNAVRTKFKWQNAGRALELDYLIYCPDARVKHAEAVGIDASRVVDAARASELCRIIQDLLPLEAENELGRRVSRFFEQSFLLAPDVHAHVKANERTLVRLSSSLAATVANIEMSPLRLRVSGVPGSGKSTVAAQAFETSVAAGKRPLLICFNRPLAERLRATLGREGGYVDTWYGLLVKFLEAKGRKLEFPNELSEAFWRSLQDEVLGQDVPEEWLFDTLIVDEGQDFDPDWYELLRVFARPGADFLWLEDANQRLTKRPPVDLTSAGFVGYRARTNYRSPASIANFLAQALPFQIEGGNTLPGMGVGLHGYQDPADQGGVVARIVADLVGRGFRHSDIVILSLRGIANSTLARASKVGPHTLKRFTGDYDLLGNQLVTPGQLLFESIYRFKGQQAPAVVVTDVDPDPANLEHWNRLVLCASTRATVRLDVVARKGNPENERLFEAARA